MRGVVAANLPDYADAEGARRRGRRVAAVLAPEDRGDNREAWRCQEERIELGAIAGTTTLGASRRTLASSSRSKGLAPLAEPQVATRLQPGTHNPISRGAAAVARR